MTGLTGLLGLLPPSGLAHGMGSWVAAAGRGAVGVGLTKLPPPPDRGRGLSSGGTTAAGEAAGLAHLGLLLPQSGPDHGLGSS